MGIHTFAGAQRRTQRREVERIRKAALQAADPNCQHWQDKAAEYGYQLSLALPSHIDQDEAWDCLGAWADEATAQVRADGYQAGLNYLENCRIHRTSPHLDNLLTAIRGRYWHNADLTEAEQ